MSISRQRSSVGAPARPISSAVWTARVRSEDSRRSGMPSRNGTSACGLLAPELGQRRVGLALQAVLGVPGRLAVADEQQAVRSPRQCLEQLASARSLRRGGQVERGARPSGRRRGFARSQSRHSRVRLRTARFHGACDSRRTTGMTSRMRRPRGSAATCGASTRSAVPGAHPRHAVAPVGHLRVGDRPERGEEAQAAGQVAVQHRHLLRRGADDEVARPQRGRDRGRRPCARCSWPARARRRARRHHAGERQPRPARAARQHRGEGEQQRPEQDGEVARRPRRLELRAEERERARPRPRPAPAAARPRAAGRGRARRRRRAPAAAGPRSRTGRPGCPAAQRRRARGPRRRGVGGLEEQARDPRRVEQRDAAPRAARRRGRRPGPPATATATPAPARRPGRAPSCARRAAARPQRRAATRGGAARGGTRARSSRTPARRARNQRVHPRLLRVVGQERAAGRADRGQRAGAAIEEARARPPRDRHRDEREHQRQRARGRLAGARDAIQPCSSR